MRIGNILRVTRRHKTAQDTTFDEWCLVVVFLVKQLVMLQIT